MLVTVYQMENIDKKKSCSTNSLNKLKKSLSITLSNNSGKWKRSNKNLIKSLSLINISKKSHAQDEEEEEEENVDSEVNDTAMVVEKIAAKYKKKSVNQILSRKSFNKSIKIIKFVLKFKYISFIFIF